MNRAEQTDQEVLVIGAGVIGLTTAICLAEAGLGVAIMAAELPQQTTSVAAGAVWGPHLVGKDDRIKRWADVTLERLAELSAADAGASMLRGIVRRSSGIAAARAKDAPPPEFAADSSGLTPCRADEIPPGYGSAWRLTAAIVAMPGYLDYLLDRYLRAGGTTPFRAKIGRLKEPSQWAGSARVIVNCTGCGARELVPDPAVTPVRGQAVVVSNPGVTEFFVGVGGEGDLTYVFPHDDTVVLGGTEEAGDWRREPDPATADRILAACRVIRPELRDAVVLDHRVGLRPARSRVRLESEQVDDRTIVHNYGHGGSGVTLSWGCAEDAAAIALAALA